MIERRPPRASWDAMPFWEGCDRGELLVEVCNSCDAVNWFPRLFCVNCNSRDMRWINSAGSGVVETFSHVYRPMNDSYKDEVPYVLALVRLDEGPHLVTRIVGENNFDVRIGDRVSVRFQPTSGHKLPVFAKA